MYVPAFSCLLKPGYLITLFLQASSVKCNSWVPVNVRDCKLDFQMYLNYEDVVYIIFSWHSVEGISAASWEAYNLRI